MIFACGQFSFIWKITINQPRFFCFPPKIHHACTVEIILWILISEINPELVPTLSPLSGLRKGERLRTNWLGI